MDVIIVPANGAEEKPSAAVTLHHSLQFHGFGSRIALAPSVADREAQSLRSRALARRHAIGGRERAIVRRRDDGVIGRSRCGKTLGGLALGDEVKWGGGMQIGVAAGRPIIVDR